jgi:hypothetical protein
MSLIAPVFCLILVKSAVGADYDFESVVDSSGDFKRFNFAFDLNTPAIRNDGHVAFAASLDNGGYGIFAGPDAEADFVAGGISCCGPIRMNNDGVVAYVDSRVIIASEPISVVADTSGPFDFFRNYTAHGINDDGVVVFQATLDDGTTGIFTGPDPAQDTVIDASGPFATLNGVDINNDGLIVFSATLDDGHSGIFTGPDPTTDTVADSRGPYASFTFFLGCGDCRIQAGNTCIRIPTITTVPTPKYPRPRFHAHP